MTKKWDEYIPEGDGYITMDKWGKDHVTTLLYLESTAVDNNGVILNTRMRCNARLHRHFANVGPWGLMDGGKYPTRLAEGKLQEDHDDWSCAEDMAKAGLIRLYSRVINNEVFGNCEGKVEFTDLGMYLAAKIRKHKANGGKYITFKFVE